MNSNSLKDLTITKKMVFFGIVIFVLIITMTIVKYSYILDSKKNFEIYTHKAVAGKMVILEIQKELNYISRCTRDIFLGNSYEKNIEKIEKSKNSILKSFDEMRETVLGTPNEKEKLKSVEKSKKETMAFVESGVSKVKSLANIDRTHEILASAYKEYSSQATPLASKSRETLEKILKTKNDGLIKRTNMFNEDLNKFTKIIIIEAIIILALVFIYLFLLIKNITTSLNEFKRGLSSFFEFLNGKSKKIEYINVKSSDEFSQMASLINNEIDVVKVSINEDRELVADASTVINRVKNGWYSQKIEATSSDKTLNTLLLHR